MLQGALQWRLGVCRIFSGREGPTEITLLKSLQRLWSECIKRAEPLVSLSLDLLEVWVDPAGPGPVGHGIGKVEHSRSV